MTRSRQGPEIREKYKPISDSKHQNPLLKGRHVLPESPKGNSLGKPKPPSR